MEGAHSLLIVVRPKSGAIVFEKMQRELRACVENIVEESTYSPVFVRVVAWQGQWQYITSNILEIAWR